MGLSARRHGGKVLKETNRPTFTVGDTVTYNRMSLVTGQTQPTTAQIERIYKQVATLSNGDIYPFSLLTLKP